MKEKTMRYRTIARCVLEVEEEDKVLNMNRLTEEDDGLDVDPVEIKLTLNRALLEWFFETVDKHPRTRIYRWKFQDYLRKILRDDLDRLEREMRESPLRC